MLTAYRAARCPVGQDSILLWCAGEQQIYFLFLNDLPQEMAPDEVSSPFPDLGGGCCGRNRAGSTPGPHAGVGSAAHPR